MTSKVGAWPPPPQSSQYSSFQSGYNPANYGQPVGSNYGQPVDANYGQPVGSNYGQPVDANYGQPVGSNYGQPVGSNYGQPVGANYGQPINAQPYPSNVVLTRQTQARRLGSPCPQCGVGSIQKRFTDFGIILAILGFPCGIIWCLILAEKRCTNCKAKF